MAVLGTGNPATLFLLQKCVSVAPPADLTFRRQQRVKDCPLPTEYGTFSPLHPQVLHHQPTLPVADRGG